MARQRTRTATKPSDARAQRSINALHDAFLKLLETTTIENITIRDITTKAGISYPTFFRRFESKEELLANIATAEMHRLMQLTREALLDRHSKEYKNSATMMFNYMRDHRQLWKALLTGGASAAMREEFTRSSDELKSTRQRSNPWIPFELAVPFVVSGIFEIFAWWLAQPEDYPIENVIALFDALITDNVIRQRKITLPVEY